MGQALVRLHHLDLLKNEDMTGWFELQNEIDLKQGNLDEDESE